MSVIGQCLVNEQHTPQITAGNWNKRTGRAAAAAAASRRWTDDIGPNVPGLVRSSRQQGWKPPMDEPLKKKEKDEDHHRLRRRNHRLQQLESRLEISRHDERLKVHGT